MESYGLDFEMSLNGSLEEIYIDVDDENGNDENYKQSAVVDVDVNDVERKQINGN